MIQITRSKIVLSLIILVLCLSAVFVVASFNKPVPSAKTRLHNIAQDLPKFDGHSITEGKTADGNCFGINEASNLSALKYRQAIAPGTFDQMAKDYKQIVTESKGITWTKGSHAYDGIQSDPFVRDGKRYTLTVNEYSVPENNLAITLSACDN